MLKWVWGRQVTGGQVVSRRGGTVLVVEDDEKLGPLVEHGLSRAGFVPWLSVTGVWALDAARHERFVAIVLDIGLPDMSGLDVCRRLRERADPTPVLMLTAASSVADRVLGLDTGADDYWSSRSPSTSWSPASTPSSGGARRRATRGCSPLGTSRSTRPGRRCGVPVGPSPCAPQEFRVLMVLAAHAGTTVTHRTLVSEAWDWAFEPASNLLEVYIATLRAKIDRPYGRRSIRTVRGFGYMLTDG